MSAGRGYLPARPVGGSAELLRTDLAKAFEAVEREAKGWGRWRLVELPDTKSSYAASVHDLLVVTPASGGTRVSLPDAGPAARSFLMIRHDSAGTLTVEPAVPGQLIDGSSSKSLTVNDTWLFYSTGGEWLGMRWQYASAGGGAVSSVFGRAGAVVAVAGDYDSDEVANASGVAGAFVSDALDALDADIGAVAAAAVVPKRVVGVTFDGGGSTPTVGSVGYIVAPAAGTIDRWYIVANASGSAVVDVWKAAGSIPTDANRIAGTEKPTLLTQQLASDTTLTTWSTLAVSVGDVFGFELESVTTCTRVTVEVRYQELP